MDNMLKLCI